MRVSQRAFTFVELIVVLVIIAILATIGFTVYESYISTGRDSKRLVELKEVQVLFQEYTIDADLPLPSDSITLTASGTLYAYQGDLGDSVLQQIGFKGSLYDAEYDEYPVFVLSKNKKDFQFLTFIEDPASILGNYSTKIYAEPDYGLLFPKTYGKPLGVILQKQDQKPIHRVVTNTYDVLTGTGEVEAHLTDSFLLDSQTDNFRKLLPDNSCKRILELGSSKGTGIYAISPNGTSKVQVYCDMEIDGGGWTMVARSASGSTGSFGWSIARGSVSDTTQAYGLNLVQNTIPFSEILIARTIGKNNINLALTIPNDERLNFQSLTGTTYQTSLQNLVLTTGIPSTQSTWNQKYAFSYFGNTISTLRYWFQHTATPSATYGLNPNGFVTGGENTSYGSWHQKQGMIFIR